jgi:ubiquinone/menaquinone biosynthesis C-methylase UbiE
VSLFGRVVAAGYDMTMASTEKAGLSAHRKKLIGRVTGRVLEIGAGTGANLPFYGEGVEELIVTEPEEAMAARLERKLGNHSLPVRVVRASAESLPFEDGSFDFAVSTLVLCSVGDPLRALGEIRRLLKPGGQLMFVEHVHSEDPKLARWQDRLNPLWVRVGHGCNCNRNTQANVEDAGLSIAELAHDRLRRVPPIVRPLIVGTAERV